MNGLHGGKKGPPLGLKHVALRIAGCPLPGWRSLAIVALVHRSQGLDSPRRDPSSPRAPSNSVAGSVLHRDREIHMPFDASYRSELARCLSRTVGTLEVKGGRGEEGSLRGESSP